MPVTSLRKIASFCRYLCTPDWNCDLRWPDYNLWLVLNGEGEIRIDGDKRKISAPQSFMFLPGQRVECSHNPCCPLEVFALHFLPVKGLRSATEALAKACLDLTLRDVSPLRGLLEMFLGQYRHMDPLSDQQAQFFAVSLFSILWRQAHQPAPSSHADRLVARLIDEIRLHPHREWSLREMTAIAGVSSTSLTLKFHKLTSRSPTQFVISTRVEHAAMLLQETSLSLAQIAEECGYGDEYFFSRQFKKAMGIAPAGFRSSRTTAKKSTRFHKSPIFYS